MDTRNIGAFATIPSLRRVLALVSAILMLPSVLLAAESNLPVPRFVSLRSNEVNLRTGPGERYPIDWVFTRRDIPVEIVAEFEQWRKIRDWQGAEGWVHERMVKGQRNIVIKGEIRALHSDPDANARTVARAEPGAIAKLLECKGTWCRIEAQDVKGWVARNEVWGVYANETLQ